MVVTPDSYRVTRRKSLVQGFIELLVDVLRGFLVARHGASPLPQYGKGSLNNKKARYTEVPTPPCSKPTPFLLSITARMISSGAGLFEAI